LSARSLRILAKLVAVRAAIPQDLPAIHAIYAHHVLNGLASFEEVPPSLEEIQKRYEAASIRGLPYLVADLEGTIAGYAYCSPYRARSAYRYALEDSVYVRKDMAGRGVGAALLGSLVERSAALGYRQLVAIIGDSAHDASIGLHESCGFVRVGTLRSVGYKHGRWVDSVIMQRPLGIGDGAPPGALDAGDDVPTA
jgi:phosphinothricin acetyltransferase